MKAVAVIIAVFLLMAMFNNEVFSLALLVFMSGAGLIALIEAREKGR